MKEEKGGREAIYMDCSYALSRAMSLLCNNVLHQRQLNSNAISQNACISQGAAAAAAQQQCHIEVYYQLYENFQLASAQVQCGSGRGKE